MGRKAEFIEPSFIHIYEGVRKSEKFGASAVGFLRDLFPRYTVNMRGDFFDFWLNRSEKREKRIEETALRLSRSRIKRLEGKGNHAPSPLEISEERDFLASNAKRPKGMMYDGCCWVAIHSALVPDQEKNLEHCHIILTDQVLLIWSKSNRRYQPRVPILGYPAFIPLAGIESGSASAGDALEILKAGWKRSGLEDPARHHFAKDDWCGENAIKVYLLEILFYHSSGSPIHKGTSMSEFTVALAS